MGIMIPYRCNDFGEIAALKGGVWVARNDNRRNWFTFSNQFLERILFYEGLVLCAWVFVVKCVSVSGSASESISNKVESDTFSFAPRVNIINPCANRVRCTQDQSSVQRHIVRCCLQIYPFVRNARKALTFCKKQSCKGLEF